MLDAMSAVPGYSHMQRDLWHEKDMEKFVDLFGALHHTKLHRTDNKLVRFDIRLNLPEIDDNPPDLIPNVLQAKRIPQSRQLRQPKPLEHYLMKGAASVGATGNDCDLLFSSQKTAIQISVPEKGNTNASTVDNTTAAPMKVWENLGPNKIEIAPRLRLGEHSPGSTSASTTLEGGSKELVSEVDLVRGVQKVLQGIETKFFQYDHHAMKFVVSSTFLKASPSFDTSSFLHVFAQMGTYISRLQTLSSHFRQSPLIGGRILQSMGISLHTFLASNHAYILSLHKKTLVSVWSATSTSRARMLGVARLFMCDDDTLWIGGNRRLIMTVIPRGIDMLNHVCRAIIQCQCSEHYTASLFIWLFVQISSPYFQALSLWIFLGELTDEQMEFMDQNTFRCLDCVADQRIILDSISEAGALLQVTREINTRVYYLSSFQWSPLQLITNLNHVQQYIDQHSDNLQTTRAAMEKYKKEQLEILADAIYDLKASRPRSETTDMQTNEDARRQLRRFQQQLQRRLLDEQIQETKSQEYRRRAQELLDDEATTRRDRESQLQIEHDKKRLIEIYDGLMADSERRHRKALWKQVRASRKLTAPSSLSNLFHMEIADWRQASNIDSQIRPQTDLNPGQLKHQRAIGAVETDERDLKNQSTIRVLQAPGGNSAENILRDNSIDEAIMPHTSVRVSQEPGGDGQTAESLIYQGEDSDENYLHSNIRLLNVPGGGGTDAFNTIYQGESLIANHINTTRVTQEPGGSGEAAIKAIYNGDLEQANAFGHTRILQEPGASGSSAENAIYRGQDEYRSDVPSVRVLQEPGGSGRSAANIIHQGGDEYVENSHIRIVQEPGGSGETVSNLLYGKALDEQDPFRATIRVTQAPGGDGSELSDTLYASFSKLGVSKSSVKILAPPGGGYDTVSKLVFGGLQEKAKTRLQDQKSNIRLEWKLFQDRTKQRLTYPSIEALQIDSTRLEGDFDQAILAYRALMDSDETIEYPPIEKLISFSIRQPILDQRAFVGSVTLSLLREHVHLMSHLGALHDLVLLNGGIWVERFMQEFTAGLDASTRVNWGVPGSLNDLLAAALDEANYNQTESSHLFAFGTTDELELLLANRTLVPPLQEVLRGIEPVYALPKVLEVVIPLPMLRVYTRIHSHLFQLKAIAYSMQSVRHTLRKYNVSSTSCHLMAHIQHHLCTTLVSHCFQSIAEEWHRFQKKVSDCNDTIDFKKHHNTFIMSIEHRCFLDPNTEQVHRNIQTCLDRVVHVVEVIQNNSTSASTLNRVLAHLLQNATDQQKEMSDLVQALRDDPSEAADELLRRLDFNDFYSPDQSC
ncbi:hypothetical protein Ae201684_002115 [Aphanomyces euteiches]|uniref:Gamma tubulin complex component C-terminal domain-containing protein n=1 Tax=Aphanomyces euteiches TaxID=100861 RepID=A0A6G0XRH9_9STRA|nr:hypothetical protein Ae201684_002115 [Aphanomyces euteiches]